MTVERDAVEVAVAHGQRQQVGDEAEPGQPGGDAEHAGHHRDGGGQAALAAGSAPASGHDRGEDQRRQGRVRAQHEDAGRAEQRVDEERHDRRVQPVDRLEPGRFRVAHAGGHEEGGEHDAGDDVLAQPRPLVRAQDADAGTHRCQPRRRWLRLRAPTFNAGASAIRTVPRPWAR